MGNELIERENELAAMRSAVAAAGAGQGAVVVAMAAGGMGKTRLVRAARAFAAEAGMRALAARGSELERDFPFGAVRQLLDPVILSRGGDAAWLEALNLAAPLLDERAGQQGGTDPGYARLHGAYWVLASLAQEQPLLISVDDAHWCDDASLRFFCFLARRLEGLPLCLLVALRAGEAGAHETLLAELTDHAGAVLRPRALTTTGVAALVAARLGGPPDPAFVRACTSTTGGNPFYLGALLGELAERGITPVASSAEVVVDLCPRDVSRYLQRRLAGLPADATTVARAVAVLGDHPDSSQLGRLCSLDQRRIPDAVHALRGAGIFAPAGRPAFVHPIARAAVYTAIPFAERTGLHARAARLLLAADAPPEQVAAQLLGVEPGSQTETVPILRQAATAAVSRGAPEAAAAYLRRALEEPLDAVERTALLVELGRYEAQAGLPSAPAHLRQALSRPGLADGARVEAAVALARVLIAHGDGPAAADILIRQIDALAGHPTLVARLEAELLAVANMDLGVRALVDRRVPQMGEHSVADKSLAVAVASYRAVEATLSGVSSRATAEFAEQALAGDLLRAEALTGGQNFIYVNLCLIMAERYDIVSTQLEATLTDARLSGSAAPFVVSCVQRSMLARLTGALGDAEADARFALEAARLNGYRPLELLALAMLAEVIAETGEAAEVVTQLSTPWVDEAAAATPQANTALESRGRLRLALGETKEGVADLLQAGERFLGWGLLNPSVYRWRSIAALGLAVLGERDHALTLAREELGLARTWGTPRALGIALRAAGLLEQGARQLELLTEAATVLETSAALLEYARALTDLGAALRRAGRLPEARNALREGLQRAARCGASVLVEQARAELRAAGGRPRRPRSTGADVLTPSERRIARLAAVGTSNPAIAQSLFITVKTVEMHLSNAYRKLGVRSRTDLEHVLHHLEPTSR